MPAGYFVGSAAASNAPWSAVVRDAQRRHRPPRRGADLDVHVVVAREARAREVLGARLDPFDGPSELQRADDRAHVTRIDRHLVAEAAADVRRDDVDASSGMPVTIARAVR